MFDYEGSAKAILKTIEGMGYEVMFLPGYNAGAAFRAIKGAERHEAAHEDEGDFPKAFYRAAVVLAESVGLELEDG